MNVRKRSGKVVPFDADFITRAISLAAAAAGEHDEEEAARITQCVVDKLKERKEEIWDIETIQDAVEETLAKAGMTPADCGFFCAVLARSGKGAVITFDPRVGLAERRSIAGVFAVGVPSAVATFLFDLDYVVLDRLMVSYHDLALAAIGIVLKVERFPLNVGVGICQGMMPLVGYNYSAGDRERLRRTMRLSLASGLVTAALSILLYELLATPLISLFLDDAQTVALASSFLRVRVLATPLMFMSFFTVFLFQALGKGNISLLLGVVRWLGFNIPMLYILNAAAGMYGLVWSQAAADSLTVILSLAVYLKARPAMLRGGRLRESRG